MWTRTGTVRLVLFLCTPFYASTVRKMRPLKEKKHFAIRVLQNLIDPFSHPVLGLNKPPATWLLFLETRKILWHWPHQAIVVLWLITAFFTFEHVASVLCGPSCLFRFNSLPLTLVYYLRSPELCGPNFIGNITKPFLWTTESIYFCWCY